jgi:hypothetical protein
MMLPKEPIGHLPYIIIFVLLVIYIWWNKFTRIHSPSFPPGPLGFPLIGYWPIITEENILVALDRAHDQFGEVVSLNLGPSPRVVVIGDYHVLKEVFQDNKHAARPPDLQWMNIDTRFGNGSDSRGLFFSEVNFESLTLHIMLRDLLTQKVHAQKKVTDFGYLRTCRI